MIGLDLGEVESEAFWIELLRELRALAARELVDRPRSRRRARFVYPL